MGFHYVTPSPLLAPTLAVELGVPMFDLHAVFQDYICYSSPETPRLSKQPGVFGQLSEAECGKTQHYFKVTKCITSLFYGRMTLLLSFPVPGCCKLIGQKNLDLEGVCMGWWMDRWVDGYGRMEGWMHGWIYGQMNKETDRWVGGWMVCGQLCNPRVDGVTHALT